MGYCLGSIDCVMYCHFMYHHNIHYLIPHLYIIPCIIGGVRVDSFIYSHLLDYSVVNTQYGGLFHVSDWFPTLLDMVGLPPFISTPGYELDGVSQWSALTQVV